MSMLALLLLACSAVDHPDDADDTDTPTGILVEPASSGVDHPVDATPSADGAEAWFVNDGLTSGLFKVVDGSAVAQASFTHASALAFSEAGALYVADLSDGLFSVSEAGVATPIAGTETLIPAALDVPDEVYFTGTAADTTRGLYRLPPGGSGPELIVGGFTETLDGVVVADDGRIYVAGGSTVYEVDQGVATAIAEGVRLGSPAGLALTPDEATLMVSSLSAEGTAQVLLIDRGDYAQSIFDEVIGARTAAGGLHRARSDASVYAWADATGGTGGTVFRITFR